MGFLDAVKRTIGRGDARCRCASYEPIELSRKSVDRRIRETPRIRKSLERLAKNDALDVALFRCPRCGQLWQSGHEWNFANQEYLFQVPAIDVSDWQHEPFRQPAAMMIYTAEMRRFFAHELVETDSPCQAEGCSRRAIRYSVLCRDHHVESLQQIGKLPKTPAGRMFPPYHRGDPDTD